MKRYEVQDEVQDEVQELIAKLREEHKGRLPVVEIFNSIDGEGKKAGQPATFIRFAGCNARCSYCDTAYSHMFDNVTWMSAIEIVIKLMQYGYKNITITGGEPLLYEYALYWIIKRLPDHEFNIETNGILPPAESLWQLDNVFFTADCKCPSSGETPLDYPNKIRPRDVVKFVVGSKEDLEFVSDFLIYNPLQTENIYIHPVFDKLDLKELVQFVKDYRHLGVRMGIQLHKIVWPAETRGV